MAIEFKAEHWARTWTHRQGVQSEIRATILAAGLGRRMDPLTARHLPKPLFPLAGKLPMTEVWVRRMADSGITDVSMNLCVLSQLIKRRFADGSKFGTSIQYVEEDKPSGTLGGICKQALGRDARRVRHDEPMPTMGQFNGSTIVAPSGDIVTNFGTEALEEMYNIHRRAGAAFTIVLVPVPWERRKDFGTVLLEATEEGRGLVAKSGRISGFFEKDASSPSNLNNASIYMIEMDLLRELDRHRTEARVDLTEPFYDFGKQVFPAMLGDSPHVTLPRDYALWGIQYDGAWFDVGQKRDYLRVNEHVLDGRLDLSLPYEKLPWGYLGTEVTIDFAKVTIVPPVVIGNNCVVEAGARLGPYAIIGDGWLIEAGAEVRHSVLWERYPYFGDDGLEMSMAERERVDRHEVRRRVTIEESIVAGGEIDRDLHEKTVDVLDDARLDVLPLDFVPQGARA